MTRYTISRAVIAAAFGGLFVLTGSAWWLGLLAGAIVFGLFLWAPHSGRYAVHPELGVTALRRDERTQVINDRAGRNAFVVSALATAACALYFGAIANSAVPVVFLNLILALGILTYFLSDFWLRQV